MGVGVEGIARAWLCVISHDLAQTCVCMEASFVVMHMPSTSMVVAFVCGVLVSQCRSQFS